MHYMDSNKTAGEEARRQLHKNAASNLEQVLAATPNKTPTVPSYEKSMETYLMILVNEQFTKKFYSHYNLIAEVYLY